MPDTSPDDAANLTTLLGEFGGLWQISRTPQGYTAQRRPRAAPPLVFTAETVPALRQLLQHGYDTAKLAAIMRDFAAGWEIEHLDPGSAWAAASRDHPTQIIAAQDLDSLRATLSRASREAPAMTGPATPGTGNEQQ